MVVDIDEASDIISHDGGHKDVEETTFEDMLSPLAEYPGKTSQKEVLMKMIAQEMVQAFVDPNQEGENEDALQNRFENTIEQRKRLRKKALRQAERNNQANEAATTAPTTVPLALDDPEAATEGTERRRNRLKAHRWSSIEGQEDLPNPEQRKITDSPQKPMREKSSSQRGSLGKDINESGHADSTNTNTTSVIEDELSIEEIRKFVLNNIPRAVREQIPEEAWGKIFGGISSKGSGVSRRSLEQASASASEHDENHQQQSSIELEIGPQEDISVISGLTSAFPDGKSIESKMFSMCSLDLQKTIEEAPDSPFPEKPNPETLEELEESEHQSLEESFRVKVTDSEDDAPRGKGVAFSTIEVRYYERTGVDNPAVTSGPAVGIGWKYKRGGRRSIDMWESKRGEPLQSYELVMDRHEREMILMEAGYTKKDIASVVRTCLKGRNQRRQTVDNLQHSGMEEAVESAQKRISKILRFGKKKSLIK
ncbi:MAG: hypothetical protein SGBAC_003617 [Bacillariaceae sp.]